MRACGWLNCVISLHKYQGMAFEDFARRMADQLAIGMSDNWSQVCLSRFDFCCPMNFTLPLIAVAADISRCAWQRLSLRGSFAWQ